MWAKSKQYSLPVLHYYCRFFTYGDLPLEQHLQQIEEEALSKFERTEPDTAVPTQKFWDKPVRYSVHTWDGPVELTHSVQRHYKKCFVRCIHVLCSCSESRSCDLQAWCNGSWPHETKHTLHELSAGRVSGQIFRVFFWSVLVSSSVITVSIFILPITN